MKRILLMALTVMFAAPLLSGCFYYHDGWDGRGHGGHHDRGRGYDGYRDGNRDHGDRR